MIKKTVLDNGVRIVTETVPAVCSVSVGFWIKAGSRYEDPVANGISHFIEHMIFKGTDKYSAFEIARAIDSVGGVLNAFTSKEYTCFYVKVLSRHLDLAADLLCDIFFKSVFDSEEIEKERGVIIQEINMVKDSPDDYIHEIFSHRYFRNHPLRHSILGDVDTVSSFNREEIVNFFKHEYLVPDKIIISAAGCLDQDAFIAKIKERFEGLQGTCSALPENPFCPEKTVAFDFRELEQEHVCMGTAGLSHVDPDRHALYILNTVLGGSMSSRLFQEIRENRGLAYSIYSYMVSFIDTGMFGIYMAVIPERIEEATEIVVKEFNRVKNEKIGSLELYNSKEQIKGSMLLSMENTDSHMSRLARGELYYNEYISVEDFLKSIDAVTSEDIQDLACRIIRDEFLNLTFLGPLAQKDISADVCSLQ